MESNYKIAEEGISMSVSAARVKADKESEIDSIAITVKWYGKVTYSEYAFILSAKKASQLGDLLINIAYEALTDQKSKNLSP